MRVGPGIIGLGTALAAAYGILLALIMREKSGRGQHIDAAFFDTAVFFMNAFITGYSILGFSLPRMGSSNPVFVPYQCFKTADKWVFIGVTQNTFWKGLCRAANLETLENDPRFNSNDKRLQHRTELIELLAPAILKFKSRELLDRLEAEGVPCAPVQEIGDLLNDPQILARKMLFDSNYPATGKFKSPNLPLKIPDMKKMKRKRPPLLGEHSVEILLEMGYSKEKIDALMHNGIILERLE